MFKQRKHAFTATLLIAFIAAMLFSLPTMRGQIRRAPRVNANQPANQTGLQFRLSEGAEAKDRQQALPVPPATVLSEAETAELLKRLPPLKTEADDEKPFALRERSLPVPRTGQTIAEAFPPAATAALTEKPSAAPLEILRFAPDGEEQR